MVVSNMSDRPRPGQATVGQPATIDVLSQEVEDMELNERRQEIEYQPNHPIHAAASALPPPPSPQNKSKSEQVLRQDP